MKTKCKFSISEVSRNKKMVAFGIVLFSCFHADEVEYAMEVENRIQQDSKFIKIMVCRRYVYSCMFQKG